MRTKAKADSYGMTNKRGKRNCRLGHGKSKGNRRFFDFAQDDMFLLRR